jgi:ketosteroid isomerase-like protein
MRSVLLALCLAACASVELPPPSADVVVAAERAFAARAGVIGWVAAFREYAAPEGRLGQPGFPNAHEALAETPDQGNTLFWWPAFAGIARSGDLGFTTGPYGVDEARTPRAHYFTVWRRQAVGSWKWIYDGGVGPIAEPNLIDPEAAHVPSIPIAASGAGSASAAIAAVAALEAGGDLSSFVAPDAHLFRSGRARRIGDGAVIDPAVAYSVTQIEASSAGDLVFVLGEGTWMAAQGQASGQFARIWQLRAGGWRIVYDQLILPRPAPAG